MSIQNGTFGYLDYSRFDASKKIAIFGTGELARLAFQYFSKDSPFEVSHFIVDEKFYPENGTYLGLEVLKTDELIKKISPDSHYIFVAISGVSLSYPRLEKMAHFRKMGFGFASYVSSFAFVADDARIGENVFIFEHNTIQSEVAIGDGVIIWSGNHFGHQTVVEAGCFISSHVCIGGRSHIGEHSYFGMNSTVRDQVVIGKNTVVGANSYVHKDFEGNAVLFGAPAKVLPGSDPMKAIN